MNSTELPAFVAELEALEAKATPGPWEFTPETPAAWQAITGHNGLCVIVDKAGYLSEEDAEFIASLRNHAPALLALVRQLQGERDQLQSRIDQASADLSSVYADVERWVVSGTNEAEIPIERVHSAIHKAIFSLKKEGDRDV